MCSPGKAAPGLRLQRAFHFLRERVSESSQPVPARRSGSQPTRAAGSPERPLRAFCAIPQSSAPLPPAGKMAPHRAPVPAGRPPASSSAANGTTSQFAGVSVASRLAPRANYRTFARWSGQNRSCRGAPSIPERFPHLEKPGLSQSNRAPVGQGRYAWFGLRPHMI